MKRNYLILLLLLFICMCTGFSGLLIFTSDPVQNNIALDQFSHNFRNLQSAGENLLATYSTVTLFGNSNHCDFPDMKLVGTSQPEDVRQSYKGKYIPTAQQKYLADGFGAHLNVYEIISQQDLDDVFRDMTI